jgi:molybdopterin converting factor small subunit
MKVQIKPFGITRDILGGATEVVCQGDTVGDLRKALLEKYPSLRDLTSLMIAVNAAYAGDDRHLSPGDEVVLIPPVSGG